MATIKSFSDLEQSKKLADILPLETADMAYYFMRDDGTLVNPAPFVLDGEEAREDGMFTYLNCWSLAALLSVLPRFIEYKGDKYYLRFMKEYIEYANDEVSITGRCLHTTGNNNLVDACYEMIIRLNELNLL